MTELTLKSLPYTGKNITLIVSPELQYKAHTILNHLTLKFIYSNQETIKNNQLTENDLTKLFNAKCINDSNLKPNQWIFLSPKINKTFNF